MTISIYYYLRVNRDDIVSVAIGGAQPNLSKDIIENLLLLEPQQSILENHSFVEIMNHRENITREVLALNKMKDLLLSKMTKVEVEKEVV